MTGPRKTPEQKVEEIDRKIADYENKIEVLKIKRDEILNPVTYQAVIQAARKQKISPKKLAETLGLKITPEKKNQEDQPGESD